LNAT
jgi:hypothetical protein